MAIVWRKVLVQLFAAALLSGCADSAPMAQLPDITKLPQKVLTKDEQKNKVDAMIESSQKAQAEAAKEIEQSR